MDEEREQLEALGYKVYDHAGDAVGLSDEEKQEMDFRIALSRAVRKRREKLGLSPKDLATRLKIGVRKVAKIEWGEGDISLEQILAAYSALGGRIGFVELPPYPPPPYPHPNRATNGANGAKPRKKKGEATA
jgi:hypothetical protein